MEKYFERREVKETIHKHKDRVYGYPDIPENILEYLGDIEKVLYS